MIWQRYRIVLLKKKSEEAMRMDMTRIAEVFSRAVDESITVSPYLLKLEEENILCPKHHQFKVAHFCIHLAEEIGLNLVKKTDLFILALLHDVGFVSCEIIPNNLESGILLQHEAMLDHCIIGEKFMRNIKFEYSVKNAIMFHHERYDGKGYFGAKGEEIPLFAQMIALADTLDLQFDLDSLGVNNSSIIEFLRINRGKLFNPALIEPAIRVCEKNEHMDYNKRCMILPNLYLKYSLENVMSLTTTIMEIIDHKSHFTYEHSSSVTRAVDKLAVYYGFEEEKRSKLRIAANLHDLGKIKISKRILEKPLPLTREEYEIIKMHSSIGEKMIREIGSLDDIADWVGQHHEKLDGSGYPMGLKEKEIDFEAQIIAVADIYSALRETRPYRMSLEKEIAFKILKDMADEGKLNRDIVDALITMKSEQIGDKDL